MYRWVKLAEAPIREIRALEQKLGVTLIAYEKVHPYKKLTEAEIAKLKSRREGHGAILVAYEA